MKIVTNQVENRQKMMNICVKNVELGSRGSKIAPTCPKTRFKNSKVKFFQAYFALCVPSVCPLHDQQDHPEDGLAGLPRPEDAKRQQAGIQYCPLARRGCFPCNARQVQETARQIPSGMSDWLCLAVWSGFGSLRKGSQNIKNEYCVTA